MNGRRPGLRALAAFVWLALAAWPAASASLTSDSPAWHGYINEASRRFGVPVAWIAHVMAAESGGRTMLHGVPIRSRTGAIGLMQLMPDTWQAMRRLHVLGDNPDDPHDNILAGTAYLRLMADRFGYPGLFAAYNAGPTRYAVSLATGRPLPAETAAYLATLTGHASRPTTRLGAANMQRLFVVRHERVSSASPMGGSASDRSLFALGSVGP